MWAEQSQDFQQNRLKYKDIREALSDSHLSEDESAELREKYYWECEEIHQETHDECDELTTEIELYREITQMSRTEIEKLQILSWVQNVDGLRWPTTFASYLEIWNRFQDFTDVSPKEVIEKYEEIFSSVWEIFNNFSEESERQNIQQRVWAWADGSFGPNTFKAIMKNPLSDTSINDLFYTVSVSDVQEDIETVDIVQQEEIIWDQKGEPETIIENTEITSTEEVNQIASRIPWDHHPELIEEQELLSDEEKIEKFIDESRWIHRMLVIFLQESVWTLADWDFWPNSARKVIEKYPEAQSLAGVMNIEWIPMTSDWLLPGWGWIESRDAFREIYWEYTSVLEENLNIPSGFIEAISRQETKYWGWKLTSPTWCKWMMQLSSIAIVDMTMEHRWWSRYRELFQNLDLNRLLNVDIWEWKKISETIPSSIIESLRKVNSPDTSNGEFSREIIKLERFIKSDSSYFNHAVNMILGSVYLAWTYHDDWRAGGHWDVRATADLYNAAEWERDAYSRNVERFLWEIQSE